CRYRPTLSSICAIRLAILACVKLRSRLFTALNLLPSIATLGVCNRPICRHSAMNFAQNLLDRCTIVLPEIGDRLMIWSQAADQPHHLDIAARLMFQAATGLHPIGITVDVKLQKDCRMIGGPARLLGDHTLKPHAMQLERLDKHIDHMDRVVLALPNPPDIP